MGQQTFTGPKQGAVTAQYSQVIKNLQQQDGVGVLFGDWSSLEHYVNLSAVQFRASIFCNT